VSSMIHASTGPLFSIAGSTISRTLARTSPVRPGRVGDKMQQRLGLGRRPRWSRPRRHRFNALAFPRQHQTRAIVAQRSRPLHVTDHASNTGYILRKPRFAISTLIQIHRALRAPNIESPQLLDSPP
jgi:hypothetical protein